MRRRRKSESASDSEVCSLELIARVLSLLHLIFLTPALPTLPPKADPATLPAQSEVNLSTCAPYLGINIARP